LLTYHLPPFIFKEPKLNSSIEERKYERERKRTKRRREKKNTPCDLTI